MGEQDHALYGDWTATGTQELFQEVGWLVELHARRTSASIADLAPLNEVAVAVVLLEPPVIAVAVHGGVAVLPLDGDDSSRAQEKMIDLAAPVTVTPQQRPIVTEDARAVPRERGLELRSHPLIGCGLAAVGLMELRARMV